MYCKLATKNIKKSYKDYSIYFLTLILAVCIFYSFNSLDSQKAILELDSSSSTDYISRLIDIMSGISVFVALILSSLIIYANNFIIKKRKKEIGLYKILGMSHKKISRILTIETFIVGIISLVVGILIGIGSSQLLSTFTLNLFDIPMDEYTFSISIPAIKKTILYFGIMFFFVILFNIFTVSKYKIIDLLTANRKNETLKFKSPYVFLGIFILSIILLTLSYSKILSIGLDLRDSMFKIAIIIATLATILFFFSLSGFSLYILKKNKNIYFKNLNIFILKQLNSKVKTNFLSISLICIMLFITLVVLSLGISFKSSFEGELNKITPFDASIVLRTNDENNNIEELLNKINFKLDENEISAIYNKYASGIKISDLFNTYEDKLLNRYSVTFIKLSEYNKLLNLDNKDSVNLDNNEVILFSNRSDLVKLINKEINKNNKININDKEYLIKPKKAIDINLETYPMVNLNCAVVINDNLLPESSYLYESTLNVKYSDDNRYENNIKYSEINSNYIDKKYKEFNIDRLEAYSKDAVYSRSKGSTTTILFIGIYLGIIFLITSMAILAIQQLSEANDSLERYISLKKIGASDKMINKTIFVQILIYFSLPLVLALIHSFIGIIISNDYISKFNQTNITSSVCTTIASFFVVYIGYFYITYIGYINVVKNNI